MDDALLALFDQGLISAEEACSRAEQKQAMRQHVAAVNGNDLNHGLHGLHGWGR